MDYLHCNPRKGSILVSYKVQILTAFKADCEAFLERFEEKKSFDYVDFASIWQLMKFTLIYADQNYASLLKLLCETAFSTIKKYLVFQKSLFIRVGAFYLLYGVYYKQPVKNMVRIRLTLSEFKIIKELMSEMLTKRQFDILYIFAKMKADNAFHYVAETRKFCLTEIKATPTTVPSNIDDTFETRGSESSMMKFKNILEDETVKSLDKTCSEYDLLLKKYSAKCSGLATFNSTIMEDIRTSHQKLFTETAEEEETSNAILDETQDNNTRQMIRKKAMGTTNAVYRGSKKVLTAVELESNEDYLMDSD